MSLSLALATLLVAAPPVFPPLACPIGPLPQDPERYEALWEDGQSWDSFLADAESRRDLWLENWASSEGIDDELVDRIRRAGGTWYILAVAIDACSDSVATIPHLARLADRVDGLELRIVDSDAGAWIMQDNLTPDGRPATPTVVLLTPDFEKRGCFIERPTALQGHLLENPDGLSQRGLYDYKMEWYREDDGDATAREFAAIVEAAARDEPRCG